MSDSGWNLSALSAALQESADKREIERQKWEKRLGEPKEFIPFEDGPDGHGTGYFKTPHGVLAVRKYHNGYSEIDYTLYSNELIDLLNAVRA